MGEKLVVGPYNRGLRNDVTAFNIDNDSFPTLLNAYQWRGRVKRKRGTSFLNRLKRFFNSDSVSYNPGAFLTPPTASTTLTFDVAGNANLITGFKVGLNPPVIQPNANIVPGSVTIIGSVGPVTYTDPTMDGFLTPTGTGGPNTIDYATGAILIPAQAGGTATATFNYFPDLPVMGLEDLLLDPTQFAGTMAFDTTYSYNILNTDPYSIYDVSFYKNPDVSVTLPGYIPKTNETPTTWNGQDYQQFYTVNYQGALWATNGINVPFNPTNIGMQFKPVQSVSGSIATLPNGPTTSNIQITAHGLVVGDFLFFNEFPAAVVQGINFQTGYVIAVIDANNVQVEFPNAVITGIGGAVTTGIAQYLTNRSDITKDALRFYDGDPTNGNPTTPALTGHHGWVNFMPPLSRGAFSIADKPPLQYYLVGARLIVPFKDRLLFFGPVIQASAANPIYIQDTVVYSQNGTPYYTASFTGDPSLPTTEFFPILVPDEQTATPGAYWGDQTGFGGFIAAGLPQAIITVSPNEDALVVGFSESIQTKLIYSGDDIVPFNFFLTNSEFGSASTFSTINMDKGVLTRGTRGIIITNQVQAQRIDLEIPDEVFEIKLLNNGNERVTAIRDFINEWAYFTYPSNQITYRFPTQTLQYNYRDNSWGIFRESYTTYGLFRRQTGFTWQTVGNVYPSWTVWDDPWNAGESTLLQPQVIAGNQQGFVMVRDEGTGEGTSLYIQNISGNTVTSPDHCLNNGDYIFITGALGPVGAQVNGKIFSVFNTTDDTFMLDPAIGPALAYAGGGLITRMYVPLIQTKQFPTAWSLGRKTRIGPQMYLLSATDVAQITLLIFLSQNDESPYNMGPIVPLISPNNSLIYSTVLFTCPESTNLGLTPANTNLNLITAPQQEQIWHRINTSLLGDTVQIGFTLSDAQMRAVNQDGSFISQFEEIEVHSFILDLNPSQLLA